MYYFMPVKILTLSYQFFAFKGEQDPTYGKIWGNKLYGGYGHNYGKNYGWNYGKQYHYDAQDKKVFQVIKKSVIVLK